MNFKDCELTLKLSRELLDYLNSKNLKATFFVIGSRVVERPAALIEEYMGGQEIAVHTWSHKVSLTVLLVTSIANFNSAPHHAYY